MENTTENIIDFDQLPSITSEFTEPLQAKNDSDTAKDKEKKKRQIRKNKQGRPPKGSANTLLLSPELKPKLSREERKNLQLLNLFEKMEQKEKKKEGNIRKKRRIESDKSVDLSTVQADSYQNEDFDRQIDNTDEKSSKSDTTSSISVKSPIPKKPVPLKVYSQYFNTDFDIGSARNLIAYLYEYQKENIKKYASIGQKFKVSLAAPKAVPLTIDSDGLLSSKNNQLESFNKLLKEKNNEFQENLKRFGLGHAMKDVRHVAYNFSSK